MNDTEREILAAIMAEPDEDGPRLAYADWLDEGDTVSVKCTAPSCYKGRATTKGSVWGHEKTTRYPCSHCTGTGFVPDMGRRERAAFIRAHIAGDDVQRDRLWNQKAYPPPPSRWIATLHPDYFGRSISHRLIVYERGFGRKVICNAAAWTTHADSLVWSPNDTMECPRCDGAGGFAVKMYAFISTFNDGWDRCQPCQGTGRIPRPMPETAQPIVEVTLTTVPTAEVNEFNALRKWKKPVEWGGDIRDSIKAEWPRIRFILPTDTGDETNGRCNMGRL